MKKNWKRERERERYEVRNVFFIYNYPKPMRIYTLTSLEGYLKQTRKLFFCRSCYLDLKKKRIIELTFHGF